MSSRLLHVVVVLLAALPVRAVYAQCSDDSSTRFTWTYPEEGAVVSRYSPVLWRFVGTPSPMVSTFDAGMATGVGLAPLTMLTPWFELAFSAVAPVTPFPVDTEVQVHVQTGQGLTLQRNFRISPDGDAPPNETLELAVHGHYVGTGVELPSERCEQLLFVPSGSFAPCWGTPNVVSIGFEVELLAVAGNSRTPAQRQVRAFAVVPEGTEVLPASRPRPWPPECGPPRLFTTMDLDQPERCFTVLAFVDAPSNADKVVRSSPYCLGDGREWPPPEPPQVDAGVPVAGVAGSTPFPGGQSGFFCGCVCPPGVFGMIACDGGRGGFGQGGGEGQPLPGVSAGARADAGSTWLGASGVGGGAGGAGGSDAVSEQAGGCGCRLARGSNGGMPLIAGMLALVLALRRGAGARGTRGRGRAAARA